ncbi:MAG TPA: ATP-dependent DNA helicase [Patescibacteria group bacterium]|nr:ATP-dependent DNA helicase [Patescibacteria group bacterium]
MAGSYTEAFKALNAAQRQAVETVDGPVLVIAGPGTGKTQLLSVRVSNILKRDPGVLPSNILCLTFTDSAAANLRERLIQKNGLGQEAYHVAIHTFNSFGSWIMTTYPEYFFAWREAATADQLTSYRIIESILDKLPGNHPLSAQGFDDAFFAITQVQNFIGDCKRANLSPSDSKKVIQANQLSYTRLATVVNAHWPTKMTDAGALSAISECLAALHAAAKPTEPIAGIANIETLLLQELDAAAAESAALSGRAQTKPFTAWKGDWLELDADKKWVFKAAKHYDKLLGAAEVYAEYQTRLEAGGLVDFNDQIVNVLAALEKHEELRLNLQERFQYIMIDEFQDTNRAQLQMAHWLTDASVHEGRPNIMVVGDDDQAIYRFQGADMSNVALFRTLHREPAIINLQENYRSNEHVLKHARAISTQITLSLEKQTGLSKELGINVKREGAGTQLHEFAHETEHYAWIAAEIKRSVDAGAAGKDIAVLARKRSQLDALVPYLRDQKVPIDYERRENVLEQEHVVALLTLARLVDALGKQKLEVANALLPEVLSHPMWHIPPADIWRVANTAYSEKRLWLDIIFEQQDTDLRVVADFLFSLSQQATTLPLEQILDKLLGGFTQSADGAATPDGLITSPFKQYYFGDDLFNQQPAAYLTLLSHISCLRRHLQEHQKGSTALLQLANFIEFVDAYQRANLVMLDTSAHREDAAAVRLMTIHKAKGQEFDTVFIVGMNNGAWGKLGMNNQRFSYPPNLREIKPSDNDDDDALRLLFVAMTRARQSLHICYFKKSEDGKAQQLFAPLSSLELVADTPQAPTDAQALANQYEQRWLSRHVGVEEADKHALLAERLANYQLSATHFGHFLDVTRGGPLYFLTEDLLKFPVSTSPQAAFGLAVHATLQHAHEQVQGGQKPTPTALIAYFTAKLSTQGLSEHDFAHYLHQGTEHLHAFFRAELSNFHAAQKVEVNFAGQGVALGDARLTGKLDLMSFDPAARTVLVTDYKTGRPFTKWELPASSADYDRAKLHRYRQQLIFYKLLVDGSADWGAKGWQAETGIVQFVEQDSYGRLHALVAEYSKEEIARVTGLIAAIWRKIQALDFPDTSKDYTPDLAGIEQFEQDLLDGR